MVQKVAFISIFRPGFGGGEGRVAHEMARHFATRVETALICSGDKTEGIEAAGGLQLLTIKSSGEGSFCIPLLNQKNTHRIFDFLDRFAPDIVHAHDPALLGLIGQVWAKMHHVPFVHTAHVLPSKALDFGTLEAVHIPANFLTDFVTNEFLTNFYTNSDALVALNSAAVREIQDFGFRGHIFTIPNGRHLHQYHRCRFADAAASEKVLTFIGFISRRKNQLYLLEMFRQLHGRYRLQLIGESIDPEYYRQLKEFCVEHRLEGVEFTGSIAHEQIPDYLERSHVLVSASKLEVQSLTLIEALASGTPVVGLSNETVDELVDDQVGCRLPRSAEAEQFADCVERLCNLSQGRYDQLCEAARARVAHLDWENVFAQTLAAYDTLHAARLASTQVQDVDRLELRRLIARVPVERVRVVLEQRLDRVIAQVDRVNQVPTTTWLVVAATMLGSLLAYLFLRRPLRGNQQKIMTLKALIFDALRRLKQVLTPRR